jgi:hypothetical protein
MFIPTFKDGFEGLAIVYFGECNFAESSDVDKICCILQA